MNNTPSNSNFGTVSYSGSGNFLVTGEHTYEGVPVSPSVTIIDETDDFHTAKYADWTVYNAPIQASGEDITAVEGVPINVEVAKFTDPDPVVNGLDFRHGDRRQWLRDVFGHHGGARGHRRLCGLFQNYRPRC